MALVYQYNDFLRHRRKPAEPLLTAGRIPDPIMVHLLIPSVLLLEALWVGLVAYTGLRLLLSLLEFAQL